MKNRIHYSYSQCTQCEVDISMVIATLTANKGRVFWREYTVEPSINHFGLGCCAHRCPRLVNEHSPYSWHLYFSHRAICGPRARAHGGYVVECGRQGCRRNLRRRNI